MSSQSKPARYHHGDLRAALLRQARALLEAEGPAALSMREIARRVGVAAPSAYHHFPGLDAIAVALAEEGFAELAQRLDTAPTNDKGQLAGTGLAYVRFALDNPGLYRMMFGEGFTASSQEGQSLKQLRQRAYERVLSGLRKRLPEEEVETAALFLWSLVHGLSLLMVDGRIERPDDSEAMIMSVLRLAGTGLPSSVNPPSANDPH
ncbi:TetR/AcrR family transcriptional regulator [Oryzifoliimicrobium ureilyticus]|uniref:TetR/AcrR family transcriptional regulator n=1 Tax=Oryzifoliimicrobium ureilyticus TaxID=3113724 RepID=UPI00307630C3